jgi:crossover junction endodeoxyribonuclease RusA
MKPSSSILRETFRLRTSTSYDFFVMGTPACQGSKVAIPRLVRGTDGRPKAIATMREQDSRLPEWRGDVARMGRSLRPDNWTQEGFFILDAFFFMPRPKAHFNSRGELRTNAPIFHDSKKDCDKMLRAIGDALTGICFADDDSVALGTAAKLYCSPEQPVGAWISVSKIDVQGAEAEIRRLIF